MFLSLPETKAVQAIAPKNVYLMVAVGDDAMEHWTKHSRQCLGNDWPYDLFMGSLLHSCKEVL